MKKEFNVIAYDCGNSTIRTILGHYDGEKIVSEIIYREPNKMIEENGLFYWDVEFIFDSMKRGLKKAIEKGIHIDSLGVCTWGIDFILLDDKGKFLQKALCYRNTIGAKMMESLTSDEREQMFNKTGILCDKINSIYMLKGMNEIMPDIMKRANKILMVPDIFVYMWTGALINEPSELSTSQMMDVRTNEIVSEQCDFADISKNIFCPIGVHGEKIGNVKKEILVKLGVDYDIPFVCVPSHDTACAALAVPSKNSNYLFVSSGTWSLIGAQIDKPIINKEVFDANLTNEEGGFGKTTLLSNSAGMFITQKLKQEYEESKGEKISWDDFTKQVENTKEEIIFDVNSDKFFNPRSMSNAIWETICSIKGVKEEIDWSILLRSTYKSLGVSFATVSKKVKKCTKQNYDKIFVVGGGTKNKMMMQTFANEIGLPIYTCSMECSSVGNAISQIAYLDKEKNYDDLRQVIVNSLKVEIINPEK